MTNGTRKMKIDHSKPTSPMLHDPPDDVECSVCIGLVTHDDSDVYFCEECEDIIPFEPTWDEEDE